MKCAISLLQSHDNASARQCIVVVFKLAVWISTCRYYSSALIRLSRSWDAWLMASRGGDVVGRNRAWVPMTAVVVASLREPLVECALEGRILVEKKPPSTRPQDIALCGLEACPCRGCINLCAGQSQRSCPMLPCLSHNLMASTRCMRE